MSGPEADSQERGLVLAVYYLSLEELLNHNYKVYSCGSFISPVRFFTADLESAGDPEKTVTSGVFMNLFIFQNASNCIFRRRLWFKSM